jgi:hypothetical protein
VTALIPIKAGGRAGGHSLAIHTETQMITPFLSLVLAGYAAFMITLGVVWVQSYSAELRDARARAR